MNKKPDNLQNLQNTTIDILENGMMLKIQLGGKSMWPFLRKGDIALVKKNKITDLKIGDIIAFRTSEKLIAHRLLKINNNEENYTLLTKGDSLLSKDQPISQNDYIGKIVSYKRNKKTVNVETNNYEKINYIIAKISPYLPIIFIFFRFFWKIKRLLKLT